MYSIKLSGTAGPESDITKVRVYVNQGAAVEVAVLPNAAFTITGKAVGSGAALVEHSFVDVSGAESPRFQQTVAVPDLQPPAKPTTPLQVVSVIWS